MPPSDPISEPTALSPGEVGIDIVLTQRIRTMLAEHGTKVLARMLTPTELKDCCKEGHLDALSVAGRLAAKEAAFKTLATSGKVLPWLDMEVLNLPGGRPVLRLHAAAQCLADQAGVAAVRISISHDGDYTVAIAIACSHSHQSRPHESTLKEMRHESTAAAAQGLDSHTSPRT